MPFKALGTAAFLLLLTACDAGSPWQLKLAHTAEGEVTAGSEAALIDAIRGGCDLKVAWGARRLADPQRTIEHASRPLWVAVRDGETVEVQLGDYLINLSVLGEPNEAHLQRERFGGTEQVVFWRANLRTDGTFDAVWYAPHSGEFIERVPQRHPMRWYANCGTTDTPPLYPSSLPGQPAP
ncbi:MAG: hypothetical protein AAFR65_06780 [Pseudomonadota bacterium]